MRVKRSNDDFRLTENRRRAYSHKTARRDDQLKNVETFGFASDGYVYFKK